MQRRQFLSRALLGLAGASLLRPAMAANAQAPVANASAEKIDKVVKTEDEWRKLLTPAQFNVLRKEGTEPPFTSPLNNEKRKGTFVCAGCDLPLFESKTKYDSGTGWPSFYQGIAGRVETSVDHKLIYPAHRVSLRPLRRTSRARVRRRPQADRPSLLQQRRCAEVPSGLTVRARPGNRLTVARGRPRRRRSRRRRRVGAAPSPTAGAFRYNFKLLPARPRAL